MSKSADSLREVKILAVELARSGDYNDWKQVERAVIIAGYPEVRLLFDDRPTCELMNDVCRIAQEARVRGLTYVEVSNERKSGLR